MEHRPLIRPILKTPQKGAATSIYLASSPEVDGVTGTYFAASKLKTSSPSSYDTAAVARLWQISLDLVARTAWCGKDQKFSRHLPNAGGGAELAHLRIVAAATGSAGASK